MIQYDPFHDPFLPPFNGKTPHPDLLPALAVLAIMLLIVILAFAILLLGTQ